MRTSIYIYMCVCVGGGVCDRLCGLVVSVEDYTEVPGSIPGHSLGFF
jgi:hypothetical protein